MKKFILISIAFLFMGMLPLLAFTQTIQRVENNGNLILEDIPPIPESIKSDLVQYQNVRSGAFRGFDQTGKNIFISTSTYAKYSNKPLRLLKSGVKTLRYNHFSFKTFNKGTNKGGLYNFYQNNPVSETVKRFYKKHFNENIKIVSWKVKDEKLIINWKNAFFSPN